MTGAESLTRPCLSPPQQHNLANAIEASDAYTVFAPNNEAIENYIREKKATTLVGIGNDTQGNSFCRSRRSAFYTSPITYHFTLPEKLPFHLQVLKHKVLRRCSDADTCPVYTPELPIYCISFLFREAHIWAHVHKGAGVPGTWMCIHRTQAFTCPEPTLGVQGARCSDTLLTPLWLGQPASSPWHEITQAE